MESICPTLPATKLTTGLWITIRTFLSLTARRRRSSSCWNSAAIFFRARTCLLFWTIALPRTTWKAPRASWSLSAFLPTMQASACGFSRSRSSASQNHLAKTWPPSFCKLAEQSFTHPSGAVASAGSAPDGCHPTTSSSSTSGCIKMSRSRRPANQSSLLLLTHFSAKKRRVDFSRRRRSRAWIRRLSFLVITMRIPNAPQMLSRNGFFRSCPFLLILLWISFWRSKPVSGKNPSSPIPVQPWRLPSWPGCPRRRKVSFCHA